MGARGFYRKLGYEVRGRGGFMLKDISKTSVERFRLVSLLNGLLLLLALLAVLPREEES